MHILKVGLILLAGLAVQLLYGQESAKALYLDELGNVVRSKPGKRADASSRPSTPKIVVKPVTGLKYWIQMQTPSGEVVPVPASRRFRTGERIQIHVAGNVDGRLSILQSEGGGSPSVLFPRKGMDNHVKEGEEKILPAANRWFRFDENPGTIVLTLKLQADGSPADSPGQLLDAGASEDKSNQTAMVNEKKELEGSKALVIEDDDVEKATYSVVDSRKSNNIKPGVIVIEIKLSHIPS